MSNDFDRIFKENADSIFWPLVQRYLGKRIVFSRRIESSFHSTTQREVDFLVEVKLEDGQMMLIHIEFQSKYDAQMIYRMAEYDAMIKRKFNMIIKHFVIDLGRHKKVMVNSLPEDQVFSGFELIKAHDLNADKMLASQIPEEIILTLLAKIDKKDVEGMLQKIYRRLSMVCESPAELNKFLKQLSIISRLRKFELDVIKIIDSMPVTLPYPMEEDAFYLRGVEKGIKQGVEKGIKQGVEKGIKQGVEKGLRQGLEKTVLNAAKEGLPIHKIQMITGLSKRDIKEILESENK